VASWISAPSNTPLPASTTANFFISVLFNIYPVMTSANLIKNPDKMSGFVRVGNLIKVGNP